MTMNKFKLYHCPGMRSARVKWLLHELGEADFNIELISVADAEQYTNRYLEINPNHCVPTLEIFTQEGDFIRISESGAIIVLLADMFPEERLAPPANDPRWRADYMHMIHFCGASMDMMLWQIRIHEHVLPYRERDFRTVERYRRKFRNEVEPQLIKRLQDDGFASGSKFSAADCMLGFSIRWAREHHLCSDAVFEDYILRLAERPAYKLAFADLSDSKACPLDIPQDAPFIDLFTG
jgi:glutathione S-transferase